MRTRFAALGLAVASALVLCVPSAQATKAKKPDATLEFSGGSVAAGVGYSWGSGRPPFSAWQPPGDATRGLERVSQRPHQQSVAHSLSLVRCTGP